MSAITKFRIYRRTLAELRSLSLDSLLDLDLHRDALKGVARKAVYGR